MCDDICFGFGCRVVRSVYTYHFSVLPTQDIAVWTTALQEDAHFLARNQEMFFFVAAKRLFLYFIPPSTVSCNFLSKTILLSCPF